jgi:hypothetical protein
MPNLELTDEEKAALLRLAKQAIDTDRYPLSPRLYPLRSILAKLAPSGTARLCPTAAIHAIVKERPGSTQDRGRDAHCWTPPARIRTSPIRASGSYLGCLTAKR